MLLYLLKMVLGPKHVVAVTTEKAKKNCCIDDIKVKLITWLYTRNRMQRP
jgi:hypothetical protein